ncbi:MAG: sugar phosphate isomerase/epimerase family protein [Phycisphaerales bacterium]
MIRRDALRILGLTGLASVVPSAIADGPAEPPIAKEAPVANPISLAQWSLHRRFGLCKPAERPAVVDDAMRFAEFTRNEFGMSRVEYVNSFYRSRIGERGFAAELRKRADDHGVKSLLIMCDGEGICGGAEEKSRGEFAGNHQKWLELAQALGCHSIRVNAVGEGSKEEQSERCADGLVKLLAVAKPFGISVIVENHGGLSSDGSWLAGVIERVGDPALGTLPDFGNWRDGAGVMQDPVRNVGLVARFAKGCSAKSFDFDASGNETLLDYPKLVAAMRTANYKGAIGIEYEGKRMSETDGIIATRKLLERLGCVA